MYRPHAVPWVLVLMLGFGVAAVRADVEIVARVNGAPVSRKAVNDVVEGTVSLGQQHPSDGEVRRLRAAALDSLVEFELLYQASAALGLSIDDHELDQEIARNKSRFPSEQSFAETLALKGMTAEDLRQDTRKMMAVSRYLERKIWRDIEISSEAVAKFYHDNREQFRRPEKVRASHILLRLPADASEEQRREVRRKALDLLSELREGADFAALARRHSEDKATADSGGDLGFFARGTMVDTFEEPLFSLMPGQITGIVETEYGLHIAKVTDRQLEGLRPLDDVRETIRELLGQRERQRRQADHISRLRRQATIEIYDPALMPPPEASP